MSLYHYLDRKLADLDDDDLFVLMAVRYWVLAARNGHCTQARLRSSFTIRRVDTALLAFLCAMTLLDRHGHGVMRFAPAGCDLLSDDEARVLSLFNAGRSGNPLLFRLATGLVQDDMAMQLAGAARQFGKAMRS